MSVPHQKNRTINTMATAGKSRSVIAPPEPSSLLARGSDCPVDRSPASPAGSGSLCWFRPRFIIEQLTLQPEQSSHSPFPNGRDTHRQVQASSVLSDEGPADSQSSSCRLLRRPQRRRVRVLFAQVFKFLTLQVMYLYTSTVLSRRVLNYVTCTW